MPSFSYEKMISGMYLGEIVRVVLEHLAGKGLLFDGETDAIGRHGCFPTKYLSEIEGYVYFIIKRGRIALMQIRDGEIAEQLICIRISKETSRCGRRGTQGDRGATLLFSEN